MIRLMGPGDIPTAMRLKQAAGWNQTALDWARLLRLEPTGCFVEERDGAVVGTTTVVRHAGDLAWIGMVLVFPRFRRRGIARGLMEHALRWLRDKGMHVSWLDATDVGRPLYVQLGFKDQAVIERWVRPPSIGPHRPPQRVSRMTLDEAHSLLDRKACGCDRSTLLSDLLRDDSVEAVQSKFGFAFGRPGSSAWFLGPCVAPSEQSAQLLLGDLLEGHEENTVFWDLLPSNASATRLATRLGFQPARKLMRMVRTEVGWAPSPGQTQYVYATAGFEFG